MWQISLFDSERSSFGDMRRLRIDKSETEFEIVKIVGIGSRLSQTISLFHLGIRNLDAVNELSILNWRRWSPLQQHEMNLHG